MVVGEQLMVVGKQLMVVGKQLMVVGKQLMVVDEQLMVVIDGCWQPSDGGQWLGGECRWKRRHSEDSSQGCPLQLDEGVVQPGDGHRSYNHCL